MKDSCFGRCGGVNRLVAVCALALSQPTRATWSIVMADRETKEVAVGTVTCLTSLDLLASVPVIVVGKGAAAVQAAGDFNGQRRPIIFTKLGFDVSPDDILGFVAVVPGHEDRQYGIADTLGRATTFSGSGNADWAGGVTGFDGNIVYAIQGNILAGDCVVPAIESALRTTAGDVAEKLMAGMEAARAMGGDGRCSCGPSNPIVCGCPPAAFEKPGHIGGMIVSRVGDIDDGTCNALGCADGTYYMHLNVPFQLSAAPDPVDQLRGLFDEWRAEMDGEPDAVRSVVRIDDETLPLNGPPSTIMHVTLLDWRQQPITRFVRFMDVDHANDSDRIVHIGPAVQRGNGQFDVELTAGSRIGTDVFDVSVLDLFPPAILMPKPTLSTVPAAPCPGDFGGDGLIDLQDHAEFASCMSGAGTAVEKGCEPANVDGDADADLQDFAAIQNAFPDCRPEEKRDRHLFLRSFR